jgi:hypothetical protein
MFGLYPFLSKLFADAGYQGPQFRRALAEILPHLTIEIVKRSDQAVGFECYLDAGLLNAPWRGSTAAAAWPRISKI